jgi:hypothetical protein
VQPRTFVTSGSPYLILITKGGAFTFDIPHMQKKTGYTVTARFLGNDLYYGSERQCTFYSDSIRTECYTGN